tara:strand:+ start:1286 stop:1555 length:270 start_codon:yes stop_codon:yes gene_type:complete
MQNSKIITIATGVFVLTVFSFLFFVGQEKPTDSSTDQSKHQSTDPSTDPSTEPSTEPSTDPSTESSNSEKSSGNWQQCGVGSCKLCEKL